MEAGCCGYVCVAVLYPAYVGSIKGSHPASACNSRRAGTFVGMDVTCTSQDLCICSEGAGVAHLL